MLQLYYNLYKLSYDSYIIPKPVKRIVFFKLQLANLWLS